MKLDKVAKSLKDFLNKIRGMSENEFEEFINNLNTDSFNTNATTIEEYLDDLEQELKKTNK